MCGICYAFGILQITLRTWWTSCVAGKEINKSRYSAVGPRDGHESRTLLDPPRTCPFLRVWVLFFETHRIRVGSGSRKYLTGPGLGLKVQTRTRTQTQTLHPPLRPGLGPYTIKYFFYFVVIILYLNFMDSNKCV